MGLFGPKPGVWWVQSKSEPRWDAHGRAASLSLMTRPRWSRVKWGGPDEAVSEMCSYCGALAGEMPLRLFSVAGDAAVFCADCQSTWWGLESFDEDEGDPYDDAVGDDWTDEEAFRLARRDVEGKPAAWCSECNNPNRPAGSAVPGSRRRVSVLSRHGNARSATRRTRRNHRA